MDFDLEKLVKLLNLSGSDNQHEAHSAISKANAMLKKSNLTWDFLLLQKSEPKKEKPNADWKKQREKEKEDFHQKGYTEPCEIMFRRLKEKIDSLHAKDFILSLEEQFIRKKFLTFKQVDSLMEVFMSVFPETKQSKKTY